MRARRFLVIMGLGLIVVLLLLFVMGRETRVFIVSPLQKYMPIILKQTWTDPRFGIAEYDCSQMEALGFPHNRYHSEQWGMPSECNTVYFSRTDHRCLRPNCAQPVPKDWPTDLYCLFAYQVAGKRGNCTGEVATESGLLDPAGLCEYLQDNPDVSIIVGNEEAHVNPGISDGVTPVEYAAWYREVWETVKDCAPTVKVGPYGPMHWVEAKPFLLDFWEAYGGPVPMDFQAVHHYAWPGFVLQDEIDSLVEWLAWLDSHVNAPAYWLTEYGLPCWEKNVPSEGAEVNRFMTGFTCWLLSGQEFQSWAWWSSCWLYHAGQRTEAGEMYLSMAQHGCVTTVGD